MEGNLLGTYSEHSSLDLCSDVLEFLRFLLHVAKLKLFWDAWAVFLCYMLSLFKKFFICTSLCTFIFLITLDIRVYKILFRFTRQNKQQSAYFTSKQKQNILYLHYSLPNHTPNSHYTPIITKQTNISIITNRKLCTNKLA